MTAAIAGHRSTSSLYYTSQHTFVSSGPVTEKFGLIIRLPGESILRIRNIKDGSSIKHVKRSLELLSGCTPSTYKLCNVEGTYLDDLVSLRLDENVSDNEVMRLCLQHPYDSVYNLLSTGYGSITDILGQQEQVDKKMAFNILFMCSFFGNTDHCRTLLSTQDIPMTESTPNGNTCLHAATAKDRVEVALALCQQGADISQKNKRGNTPLDVALEFGSFTCERRLRLSQWSRRKAKITQETVYTQSFTNTAANHNSSYETQQSSTTTTTQNLATTSDLGTDSCSNNNVIEAVADIPTQNNVHVVASTKYTRDGSNVRPSTASVLYQRPTTKGSTRSCMSSVNHQMPQASIDKKKERLSRVRSAPLLNSEARSQRLCKEVAAKQPAVKVESENTKKGFTMTKPQYLQYIKSSTGIVEEDYFADIFPEQDDEPTDSRSFDDQMKRNERIFKKMFKQSGVAHQSSDTDSEEELAREYANKKAVKRWNKKQLLQKREERKKLTLSAYSTNKDKHECLGNLLMIGDTSQGNVPVTETDKYIRAYQTYRQGSRVNSAPSPHFSSIDPVTYEQWMSTKPHSRSNSVQVVEPSTNKPHLVKKIDYKTWLDSATERINKQVTLQRKEAKQKKDFEGWIQGLKDEVGTYDYWKRRKEEQLARERRIQIKKQQEEKRKSLEKEKRKELAKDIYKHWALSKEMSKLEQEEKKLAKEKERLRNIKTNTK